MTPMSEIVIPTCPECGTTEFVATTVSDVEFRESLIIPAGKWERHTELESVLETRLVGLECRSGHSIEPGETHSALAAAWNRAEYFGE